MSGETYISICPLIICKKTEKKELENVFVKHYAPNHMPDPKGEWSLKENISELHYGICSELYQFIYTLVFNYMPIMRILAKGVLQISRSKGCSYFMLKAFGYDMSNFHLLVVALFLYFCERKCLIV